MPTYVLRCPQCGDCIEETMTIAEYDEYTPPTCCTRREFVIQPVRGYVQMNMHYKSIVTGDEITSWRKREEEFAREGLMDASDMEQTWKDDIGKLPKWQRPITKDDGTPYEEKYTRGITTFEKRGKDEPELTL